MFKLLTRSAGVRELPTAMVTRSTSHNAFVMDTLYNGSDSTRTSMKTCTSCVATRRILSPPEEDMGKYAGALQSRVYLARVPALAGSFTEDWPCRRKCIVPPPDLQLVYTMRIVVQSSRYQNAHQPFITNVKTNEPPPFGA
jgi:hypothetical protein